MASSLAVEYGSPPVAGPAVISGPIMDNTIHPLNADDADRLATRLRGNGVTPAPVQQYHLYGDTLDRGNLANIGHHRLLAGFTRILAALRTFLRPGGHIAITIRPWR